MNNFYNYNKSLLYVRNIQVHVKQQYRMQFKITVD